MKKPLSQQKPPHQVYMNNRETDESKLLNSQARVKAFVVLYLSMGEYNRADLGEVLAQSFTFFRKIYHRNGEFFSSLMEAVDVRTHKKGEVLVLLNESAESALFILEGRAKVYVKGGMSPERAKGFKEEYGQEFQIETMNPVSKRKSNLIQEENSSLDLFQRRKREHDKIFTSQDEIKEWFPQLFLASNLFDLDSLDESSLKKNIVRSATVIADTEMVVLSVSKAAFREKTFKHDNIAVQTDEKLEIIRSFGLFRSWDSKLNSLMMYFERRKYKRGDMIYKEGEQPTGFYLVLAGEVEFSLTSQKRKYTEEVEQQEKQEKPPSRREFYHVDVELLGRGAYFGEIELLTKKPRQCTAKCITATCQVLFLNRKNFFLIGYQTDMFYLLKQKLPLRQQHRQAQQENALRVKSAARPVKQTKFDKVDYSFLSTNGVSRKSTQSKINNHKQPLETKTQFFHGNIIQDTRGFKPTKRPYFSMLESNKDMYKDTVKKFRRFVKKPKQVYKPELNWDMKRIWKVLNLDGVLEEESHLAHHKEGLEFFYKHERLQNQIQEARSLRPRTSSCSYRDKVKYIRYLDTFGRKISSHT